MKKQLIGIFIVMLLICGAVTTILYSNNVKVEASGGRQQGSQNLGLDYNFIWNMTDNFSKVIYRTDWSQNGENNIPKGRSWATAGENYTIENILKPNMNGIDKPCGLTGYKELEIGYIPGPYGREPNNITPKKYSTKIVIQDYGLTLFNNGILYKDIPYNELFPYGIGVRPNVNIDDRTHFNRTTIRNLKNFSDIYPFSGTLIKDYYNISGELLNYPDYKIAGLVQYIQDNETLPESENQSGLVFILNENPSCEQKMENMTNAQGCILIENTTKAYNFTNASKQFLNVVRVDGTETNFSKMLNELNNGSAFFVDNMYDSDTFVFSNLSNTSFKDPNDWVGLMDLYNASSGDIGFGRAYLRNIFWYFWNFWPGSKCKGFILSDKLDTHFMLPTVTDWGWFHAPICKLLNVLNPFGDRFWLPMFSVNETVGRWLRDNITTATVTGFIDQECRRQTSSQPGVISHNVVAYRNISHSPGNAIAVLSNRMDGWWSETPGDSGVGGAILLGIGKYMNDNDITPKYNLTFLFTTGEEYGCRGAYHYIDSHPNGTGSGKYNFVQWIGIDQVGFNYTKSTTKNLTLEISTKNSFMQHLIQTIADETNYENRTHYYELHVNNTPNTGSEDDVWKDNCWNTICFGKDSVWDGWHRTGANFQKGDSLNYIDPNDVRVVSELIWNITRYFIVNPNCRFSDTNYEAVDSNGGTIPDSLKATFTVESVLPSDRIMVNASLYDASTEQIMLGAYQEINLTINRAGVEHNITFSMPAGVTEGDYYMKLEVYNSTARINRALGLTNSSNDTETSPMFHLNKYHTLGDIRIGILSENANNIIRGSRFTPTEYALISNITAYVSGGYNPVPTYQCLIYRISDGQLIGASNPAYAGTAEWRTFTFSTKPVLLKNTEYMFCIWGNTQNAHVYATSQSQANAYQNTSCTFGNPPQHITWDMAAGLFQFSIFCSYTLDTYLPEIPAVTHSPDTVGFGDNVTINATVTDYFSGVNLVKVQVASPLNPLSTMNYTMTHVTGNTYRYVFTNTWLVGQYNYTIWVTDNNSNVNSSNGHHFHVSADAKSSICTLKNSYSGNQYINITDPPNPPENLTLVDRGLDWNNYYNNVTGQNILEITAGPINYQNQTGEWTPIDSTLRQLSTNDPAYSCGYRLGNDRGLYHVYFKPNVQNDWPVAFAYNKSTDPSLHVIRSKLVGVGYLDPQNNWAYQYLQNVQSSQGQTNGNTITYTGIFTGTDVSWSYGNTELKEAIVMSNATKTVLQNHPPSSYGLHDASSYLVFITKLDYQNLNLYNTSGMLNGNVTITDNGVDFKDSLGVFKCGLPLGDTYELNNQSVRQHLTYRIIHSNGNTYLLSGVKIVDLNAMVFPVVIDPTLRVYSTSSDGYIYKSSGSYSTARTASSGTVSSSASFLSIGQKKDLNAPPTSTYTINRGFVLFNTSALPWNAFLDNATFSLYKKDDYSTTDFNLTIQNGQPAYPHDPLLSSDYNMSYYSGNGGTFNTATFHNGYNNMSLTSLNWINRNGTTKLCLRSSRDINGNAPTGNEYVNVYANELGSGYQPRLVINYRNQSKIKDTGSTNIKGYLLIQVQYYNAGQGKWLVDNDTVNETSPRTITSGSQLALDRIFNGLIRASDLRHGFGTYRVYTAFRDPAGNILKVNDGTELKAWWNFYRLY